MTIRRPNSQGYWATESSVKKKWGGGWSLAQKVLHELPNQKRLAEDLSIGQIESHYFLTNGQTWASTG